MSAATCAADLRRLADTIEDDGDRATGARIDELEMELAARRARRDAMMRPLLLLALLAAPLVASADEPRAHYATDESGAVLPDATVTPGAVRADATRAQLCAAGFTTKKYRHTSHETKCRVYALYGYLGPGCRKSATAPKPATGSFEVDHLIPLTLGGADVVENLWPESADPTPGFHEKDKLENEAHRRVCRGEVTLVEAQTCMRTDWHACYVKWVAPKAKPHAQAYGRKAGK
ncbi:MAG: HNH endonuclease [Steroidobacteraceae bacterium]